MGSSWTNDLVPDVDDAGRRMALALLLALGLHAVLLLGVPTNWRSFHFPAPSRFDVVLLPPAERLAVPERVVAPGPAKPEAASGASVAITGPESAIPPPEPRSDTPPVSPPPAATPAPPAALQPATAPSPPAPARPEPAIVARPVRSAPTKPAVVARPAPKSPAITKSTASPKPVKPRQIAPVEPLAQPAVTPRKKIPPPVKPVPPVTARPAPRAAPATSRPGRPDSIALLGQIAGLEADAERKASAGVRSKWVSLVDTRSPAGFYAADWARKVMRIGEMNFPDAARRLNQSAGPLLEVAIRADGSLREVRVVRSSGSAELDRAARRIVELAAPYPPFPAELRQQVDLLKIESPWRFDPGGRIQAR